MNVEEYVEFRKKELEAFAKHWRARVGAGDDHYPESVGDVGEWFEQELAFIQHPPVVDETSAPTVKKRCEACRYSFMEPSDMNLTCGHSDAGSVGKYIHVTTAPTGHCGPELTKFEQHPLRNEDGTLKTRLP